MSSLKWFAVMTAIAISILSSVSSAQVVNIPSDKATKAGQYLTARGAYNLVQNERARILFVDIRTRAELAIVGMTQEVDGHVPYVEFNDFWEWDSAAARFKLDLNQHFGAAIARLLEKKGLGKNDKIVLMCRSGDRSARAANLLTDLGYTNVISVVDGFEGDLTPEGRREVNGWKNAMLPWSYKLDRSKIYSSK